MSARTLYFSEPSQVLEALQLAAREPDKTEIPHRLRATMEECEATGLVAWIRHRFRSTLYLTEAGRARVHAARRAGLDTASAPVRLSQY